jgi:hypothetical protein
MHCTISISAHVYSYMLDHTEPELEERTEQTQVEDLTNLSLIQGKPWCLLLMILDFSFLIIISMLCLIVHHVTGIVLVQ